MIINAILIVRRITIMMTKRVGNYCDDNSNSNTKNAYGNDNDNGADDIQY